jgi:hypothetical protein
VEIAEAMQVEKNGNAKDELIAFNDGELGT